MFCGDYYSATSVFVVGGGALAPPSLSLSLNEESHYARAQRNVRRFLRRDAAVTAAYIPFCRG